MPQVAYNAYDPQQAALLAGLAQGESGGASNSAVLGVGGTDLTGASTDQFGFPIWGGTGNSHAAGIFQFQPSTWDAVAGAHDLNFKNPADQAAGAWYLAQDTFKAKTGGDLETALQSGDYSSVQNALAGQWPSVFGNAAQPKGLAGFLAGIGGALSGAGPAAPGSAAPAGSGDSATAPNAIEGFFERGGLVIIGGLVVVVALFALLQRSGVVDKVSRGVGHAAALAAAAA